MQTETSSLSAQKIEPVDGTRPQSPRIAGFLIVVAIGLVISFLKNLESFGWSLIPFRGQVWERLTTTGTIAYHPYWKPVLLFGVLSSSAILLITVLALFLFFRKQRLFPKVIVAGIPMIFLLMLVGYYLQGLVPAIAATPDYEKQKHVLMLKFIALHVWLPYFLVSNRVKQTFVR
ncbi:MAG TPA: DUF2569 domain-containing protein [Pyrinomonadaceae bacterium]|nr:DUF2569 domain-containing protein [Pyrinomonadaceae bacterium]